MKPSASHRRHIARLPEPGRDGQPLVILGKVRANETAKGPDTWAAFSSDHPIEIMRVRGSLGGGDTKTMYDRYRAARAWGALFERAAGSGYAAAFAIERVCGSRNPQGGMENRIQAALDLVELEAGCPGLGRNLFPHRVMDLNLICGEGRSLSYAGRAQRPYRGHSSVRLSLFTALDCLADYRPFRPLMERVAVLAIFGVED